MTEPAITVEGLSHAFGAGEAHTPVLFDLSLTVPRGELLVLRGASGSGKTTLLKMILGELQPDSGTVKQGANLNVAYFDQMRDQIDLNATLEDFISPGSEWIEIGRAHV